MNADLDADEARAEAGEVKDQAGPALPSWLGRYTAQEWVQMALTEIRRAEEAYGRGDGRAGLAGCRRAAGMALNAALRVDFHERWGRTYAEHLVALPKDEAAPPEVRAAAKGLMEAQPPGGPLTSLRRPNEHVRLLEAARDVMAHGYALAQRGAPAGGPGP